MKKLLISKNRKQYKANLHSHSNLSDGFLSPEEMRDAYANRGYSVLCVSDHEFPCDHSDLTTPDMLMLTGYEVYIRNNPEGVMKAYEPEVHLNLFAKDPRNEKYISYDYPYAKYIRRQEGKLEALEKAGKEGPRLYSREYINGFIKDAQDNGYLVSYNHPVWSLEEEADVLAYDGFFSLEICNYGSYKGNGLDYNTALYMRMLRRGKKVFVHAGDDNHNKKGGFGDSFGAWTMIEADSLTYENIIAAMEKGDTYASTGPEIYELSYEDGSVSIECSPAKKIFLYNGSKRFPHTLAPEGESITSATFKLDEEAKFFFISVVDEKGGIATTRGYLREEL